MSRKLRECGNERKMTQYETTFTTTASGDLCWCYNKRRDDVFSL